MGLIKRITLLFILSASLYGCSSTSWVVVNEDEIDRQDFELLQSEYFLDRSEDISPNQPSLTFTLKTANSYRYNKRIKTERYIQRYKPRAGYVIVGLLGASLAGYAAYSDRLISQPNTAQKATLLSATGLLTSLAFLNMKPSGEPAKTGETKLLRKSGSVVQSDTSVAKPYLTEKPELIISYKDDLLVGQTEREFINDRIIINLAEELDPGIFSDQPEDPIIVEARYGEDTTRVEVPVSSVFEKFVVVKSSVTPLRNDDSYDESNILTELATGSNLRYVSQDSNWVKVLYGISENYVARNDVETIWRPAAFTSELSVITVPNIPFGAIDVERNLPRLNSNRNRTANALVISNYDYKSTEYPDRIYGERDTRLFSEILNSSLNIPSEDIVRGENLESVQSLSGLTQNLSDIKSDQKSKLFVFISSYAAIENDKLYLYGTGKDGSEIVRFSMESLFQKLASLNYRNIQIISDIDILSETTENDVLVNLGKIMQSTSGESVVLFSSATNQRSGLYASQTGEQNRHSIFTYFFANALKQGLTNYSDIYDYLERNVPFVSRSIYESPQNVQLFGNPRLDLRY